MADGDSSTEAVLLQEATPRMVLSTPCNSVSGKDGKEKDKTKD